MVPNSATHHIFIYVRNYSLNRGRKLNVHKTFRRHPRQQAFYKTQKQPSEVFYNKRCSQKFCENSQENTCAKVSFLDPRRQPEGFYEMGSVRTSVLPFFRPSFRLARRLLGIVSLFLSKFWHGARNPFEVMHGRAGFSRKMFFCPKNYENGPKTGFFKFNVWNNNNYFGLIQVFY